MRAQLRITPSLPPTIQVVDRTCPLRTEGLDRWRGAMAIGKKPRRPPLESIRDARKTKQCEIVYQKASTKRQGLCDYEG